MFKSNFILLIPLCMAVLHCKINDPEIPNEEEVITTLKYSLTPATGGSSIDLLFRDLDGDGGITPLITAGHLAPNTVYHGKLELLNEQEIPNINIAEEILEESGLHQFFFIIGNGLNAEIKYDDLDGQGHPVGLKTILTTKTASQGNLDIVLRHQPDKSASGVASGNISLAGGETDLEIEFQVNIK